MSYVLWHLVNLVSRVLVFPQTFAYLIGQIRERRLPADNPDTTANEATMSNHSFARSSPKSSLPPREGLIDVDNKQWAVVAVWSGIICQTQHGHQPNPPVLYTWAENSTINSRYELRLKPFEIKWAPIRGRFGLESGQV